MTSLQQQRTASAIAASQLRSELSSLRVQAGEAKAYIFRLEHQPQPGTNGTGSARYLISPVCHSPPLHRQLTISIPVNSSPSTSGSPPSGNGSSCLGGEFDDRMQRATRLLEKVESPTLQAVSPVRSGPPPLGAPPSGAAPRRSAGPDRSPSRGGSDSSDDESDAAGFATPNGGTPSRGGSSGKGGSGGLDVPLEKLPGERWSEFYARRAAAGVK